MALPYLLLLLNNFIYSRMVKKINSNSFSGFLFLCFSNRTFVLHQKSHDIAIDSCRLLYAFIIPFCPVLQLDRLKFPSTFIVYKKELRNDAKMKVSQIIHIWNDMRKSK